MHYVVLLSDVMLNAIILTLSMTMLNIMTLNTTTDSIITQGHYNS
jgi:hypothetical protein